MDVSFTNFHEHSFHGSSENQFDSLQVKLQFEQYRHSKQIAAYFEGYHIFNDPVADYMDKFFSWDSWLCFLHKDKIY